MAVSNLPGVWPSWTRQQLFSDKMRRGNVSTQTGEGVGLPHYVDMSTSIIKGRVYGREVAREWL